MDIPAVFAATMERLGPFEDRPLFAVAVSGGSDSLALTLLLADWVRHRQGHLVALTVDHGLRPQAAIESQTVHDLLTARGIEHHILTNRLPWSGGDIQNEARAVRYRLLNDWCVSAGCLHLVVAHHQDDQAETVLLRLARGSGAVGLSGMAEVSYRPEVRILRPLLGFTRQALRDWLGGQGVSWIEDPSNQNPSFARVQWRSLSPELAARGMSTARLAETAQRLARVRTLIERDVAACLARHVRLDRWGWAEVCRAGVMAQEEEIALRVLAAVLTTVGGQDYGPRADRLERLYDTLLAQGQGEHRQSLHGCVLSATATTILIAREARVPDFQCLPLNGDAIEWDGRFRIALDAGFADACRLRGWKITVGHVFSPLPSLKDGVRDPDVLDKDEKSAWCAIPGIARPGLPALYEGKRLLAIPALGWRSHDVSGMGALVRLLRFQPRRTMAFVGFRLAARRGRII